MNCLLTPQDETKSDSVALNEAASAAVKIQFHFDERFFRAVEEKCGKALHGTPIGTGRSNLAASIPMPDDATDNLVSLHPLHPPDGIINVVRMDLNCSIASASSLMIPSLTT
jgi:hypothetical protein